MFLSLTQYRHRADILCFVRDRRRTRLAPQVLQQALLYQRPGHAEASPGEASEIQGTQDVWILFRVLKSSSFLCS